MTLRTVMLIQDDESVYAAAIGPIDGKYGLYVGMLDETPSGCKRPRDLLTSEPIYSTPEEAKAAAEQVIRVVQEAPPVIPMEATR